MRIFALETNEKKLIQTFLSAGEEIVLHVKFSAFLFILRTVRSAFFTLVLVAIGIGLDLAQLPWLWDVIVLGSIWFFGVLLPWITAFVDWRFDVLLITTEEVVVVDQSSVFHVSIRQMNMDNIASVASESQFFNIFPFGRLHFDLKEGVGKAMTLSYIPQAARVASVISNAIVLYQRRRVPLK